MMSNELLKREPAPKTVNIDESISSKNEKGKNLHAANFLKNNHPELFEVLPRRGGFRRHSGTRRNAEQGNTGSVTSQLKVLPSTTTKSRTQNHANIEEVFETDIRCPAARESSSKDDRKNNTVFEHFNINRGISRSEPTSGSVMTAIRPPHWLYHDHALGVIWMLFHDDKNYIGISQLQWCLRFLLDLKNSQSEYAGDVDICIQAIQDNLIEQYARLGMVLEGTMEENSKRGTKRHRVPIESIHRKNKENQVKPKKSRDVIKHENDSANTTEEDSIYYTDNQQGDLKEEMEIKVEKRNIATSAMNERINDEESHCHSMNCGILEPENGNNEMISFTYNEMISKGSAPCTEEYSIEDLFDNSIFFDETNVETIKNENLPGINSVNVSAMVNFLNFSRQQHIERIKKEIERLYGLERFMSNFNANGFSAYVTEDLAKRMEHLKNEDVVKELRTITR